MADPKNIISAIFETARLRGDSVCARFKRGDRWQAMSWGEFVSAIETTAAGLRSFGLRHRDRVAILGPSGIEWTIADLSVMAAGGIVVPIYSSLTAERIAPIIDDARPSFLFLGAGPEAGRCREAIRVVGRALPVIALWGEGRDALTLASLGSHVSREERAEIAGIVAGLDASDTATIVYTSGTTGEQKGVVLTHGNILAEVRAAQQALDFRSDEVGLLCLPLAHVLGRLMQFYVLAQGCVAAYAEGIERLAENYVELSPHFLCGVPRMLEKIVELVQRRAERSPRIARRLFRWAIEVGRVRSDLVRKHRRVPWGLRASFALADRLVFRRIRAGLGGRLRCFICGGAPLSEEVAKFFHAAGILVLEGWGLTETFAAATVNRADDFHFGTVGKPLAEVELNLAPDGEVLVRGPTVFKEYWNMPGETRAAFEEGGWFKTGDLGEYSRDGFLRITGRKKEIIITSGGKNIAPQMIETMMAQSPYVSHFLACGDGRKYLAGLVTLNREAVGEELARRGIAAAEPLSKHPAVQALIWGEVEAQNRKLAPFETIKRIAILDREFTVESGELTPTLKIRRAFVVKKYGDVIEGLYRE